MPSREDTAGAIAYAIWRSPHRGSDLKKLDNCRLVAADVMKHLDRCGLAVEDHKEPGFGAAHLAQGVPD